MENAAIGAGLLKACAVGKPLVAHPLRPEGQVVAVRVNRGDRELQQILLCNELGADRGENRCLVRSNRQGHCGGVRVEPFVIGMVRERNRTLEATFRGKVKAAIGVKFEEIVTGGIGSLIEHRDHPIPVQVLVVHQDPIPKSDGEWNSGFGRIRVILRHRSEIGVDGHLRVGVGIVVD